MKHLHLTMVAITILLYLYQAAKVFLGKPAPRSKAFTGVSHLVYTLLTVSGLVLFWQLYQATGTLQHWAIAKLVLLVVAVSANIKAVRNQAVSLGQAKAGMLIAGVAYVGIVVLAITKPML